VEFIQQDAEVHSQELVYQENVPSWGLGRVSSKEPGNTTYVYDSSAGEGTCAYVIDTGILTNHTEFEGRKYSVEVLKQNCADMPIGAEWLENFTGDGIDADGYGHGTHVAGTIGGVTYGVAKKTKLYAVKVLNSSGSGTYAGVIAGIDYVANDAQTRDCPKGAVANMSLGGGYDASVNAAVSLPPS
jgi:subtilisin family serine protease